ncbi:glutaredoxin family protein [Luteimonas salinilitoris]|uniref:Glutaredoxin family protein n=1 Tax=Luteimonas salinilitoris TaxID=3237697 RepID=A0ABV4HVF2_9GAMM
MKGIRGKSGWKIVVPLLFLAVCAAAGIAVGRYIGGSGEASPVPAYHVAKTSVPQKSGDVTIYTMSTCAASQEAKSWLAGQGIAYTEKVVDQSEQALSEVKRLGAQRTPLLLIGRYQMEGFDSDAATQLIAGAGPSLLDDG